MLCELEPQDFGEIRPLFRPLTDLHPFCTAALAGIKPGRVAVDHPTNPQTAFLITEEMWCFLAGNPNNQVFLEGLNRAILDREIIGPEVSMLLLACPEGESWQQALAAVLHPRRPLPAQRRHYTLQQLQMDWHSQVPAGFSVERMDFSLLQKNGWQIPDEVRETLTKWQDIDHPDFRDFGYVAVNQQTDGGPQVVAWATVDAVVEEVGDVGLFTDPAYRRRGLALLTTAAAVEYGFNNGLKLINWTCAEDNLGSIRTAERLGFERGRDHRLYFFAFDQAQHLSNWAYSQLQAGEYQQCADSFAEVFVLNADPPYWAYHDAARAWAGLGDQEKALGYLQQAVKNGWKHLTLTQDCEEFEPLHQRPEWTRILQQMQS